MKRLAPFLLIGVLLIGAMGWYAFQELAGRNIPSFPAASAAQPKPPKSDLEPPALVVDPAAQQASGIEVAPLAKFTGPVQQIAYATVLDLKSLFDLHTSYATARANRDAAKVQAETSAEQYQRQRRLYNASQAASQKTMQDAEVAMKNDEAKLKATEANLNDIAANAREQFGDALSAAILDKSSDLLAKLAERKASVLLVTFPPATRSPAPAGISVDGDRQGPIQAGKLSVAPQADPSVQGDTYLYLASGPLPLGTRTIARASTGDEHGSRALVPDSAVLWYGGQQWVYARLGTDQFVRRPIHAATPVANGLLVEGFRPGDLVVVQGAQLLLSQELKPKDIATQCKDPPECDD